MKTLKLASTTAFLFALASTASAAGNGADGWYKLQQQQAGEQTQSVTKSDSERASDDAKAAQAIAANPSNYNTR